MVAVGIGAALHVPLETGFVRSLWARDNGSCARDMVGAAAAAYMAWHGA